MDNCLVTKLKETVQNDSLKKLGVLRIHVNPSIGSAVIRFYCDKALSVDVVGDGGFSYFNESPDMSQTHKEVPAGYQIDIITKPNAEFDIELSNKYALTSLQLLTDNHTNTININDLEYSYKLKVLNTQGSSDYKSTGSLNSIANLTLLTDISLYYNDINGSIESLGKLTSLTTLTLATTFASGSINALADSMVANGRTSGVLTIMCNGIITYNNNILADFVSKSVKFGSSMQDPTTEETNQGWQVV